MKRDFAKIELVAVTVVQRKISFPSRNQNVIPSYSGDLLNYLEQAI